MNRPGEAFLLQNQALPDIRCRRFEALAERKAHGVFERSGFGSRQKTLK